MIYKTSCCPDFLSLSFEHGGTAFPTEKWDDLSDTEHATRWWLIQELLDNGQATTTGQEVQVPHEEIVSLSRSDQQLLGLPDKYPFDIRLDAHGTFNRDNFRYEVGFFAHPDGEELRIQRTGAVLRSREQEYLLGDDQYTFCKAVAEHQNGEGQDQSALQAHSKIKDLASEAGVVLDSYLQKETAISPEKIEVDVELEEDTFLLAPRVQGADNEKLQQKFERFPKPLSSYLVSSGSDENLRVAFSDRQKDALETLKEYEETTEEERDALVEHPETILDPEVFDLDLFSERVVELGFYEPTFYPFISPYESQWIPGFVVETSPEEREQVRFDTEEELDEFEETLETARAQGDKELTWDDIDVPVSEAERIVEKARDQFDDPETPVTERDDTDDEENQVLVIQSNIEAEEYSEAPEAPSTESFEHAYQPPPRLKDQFEPREHQRTGIAWMQSLLADNHAGGLLADDMGLGKTFQVLSFIKWHRHNRNSSEKPYLIVAPVTLLENWEQEYRKFFEPSPPPVEILHGKSLRSRVEGDVEAHWREGADELASEGGMYITTYGSLRLYQLLFGAVNWAVVVLDEAQRIKNPSTQVTSAAKALKADFKLPMTGTPVENSLVDLWCLVDFAIPGLLGSAKEFAEEYQHPLRDEETDVERLGNQLRGELGVYIKRRLKSDVIGELPEKEVHRHRRPMPEAQHERYQIEIDQTREAKASGDGGGQAVLKALHAMRLISDHPYLPDRSLGQVSAQELIPKSAKLKKTVDILRSVQERGEKAILYADRKVTQRMLAKVLRETFGAETRIINGDTPAGKTGSASKGTRQELINRFEDRGGFGALVMSPIAAGLGLNITAANHVIHYARHWNPAREDQATDRVHRIGQPKKVHVYYPMCTIPGEAYRSFDQILDDLLKRKRELADASLFPSEEAEVKPDSLYDSVLDEDDGEGGQSGSPIGMETAESLDPYLFEALIALLWKQEGFRVHLTPEQSDRGADVVALQEGKNALIQVKQKSGTVGMGPVREVYTSAPTYEEHFDVSFDELVVITTAPDYTSGAEDVAQKNDVTLLGHEKLAIRLERHGPSLRSVREQERRRMEVL